MSNYNKLKALQEDDPEGFRRLLQELNSKTKKPHAGQLPVIRSDARFKVLNCGRRWGKTVLAAKIAISKTREPGLMVWWVAPTYRVVKRGYVEFLKQLPADMLVKPAPPDSHFDSGRPVVLHFKNGTKMEWYSAERPEGMLGAAVDFVVMDEAAIMPARIWNQVVQPTLIDHQGSALMISTPRGRNWFYTCWLKGQDEAQKAWESWTFTTQDNPTLPPGEADRMAADMPQMEADQEIYAKWVASGSSVFILEDYAIQKHTMENTGLVVGCELKGTVFLGVDLARTKDYTVLYGEMESTRQNVFFERMQAVAWAEQRRRIKRAVGTLRRNGASHVVLMVDDGNAGTVIIEDLLNEGYDVVGINFTTHKSNMVRLLANDLERGKAFILEEGVHEFQDYQMNMTAAGKMQYSAPDGGNDDIVAAKMLAHWGCVNEGTGDITFVSNLPDLEPVARPASEDNFEDDEYDDYSDLELSESELMESLGYDNPLEPPDQGELLRRGWF